MSSVKCVECGASILKSVECRVKIAKFKVQSAACKVWSVKCQVL